MESFNERKLKRQLNHSEVQQGKELPLGWTKVRRRRSNQGDGQVAANDTCCPPVVNKNLLENEISNSDKRKEVTAKGTAILCLHEINPAWFQGYFFSTLNSKPWGLLGVQEEVDDCLKCQNGGYNQISLTVFPEGLEKQTMQHIDWTGGDMMKLRSELLSFEPTRLLTGDKAVEPVKKYFSSLVSRLQTDRSPEIRQRDMQSVCVLEVLPDVAVVVGAMKITLKVSTEDEVIW